MLAIKKFIILCSIIDTSEIYLKVTPGMPFSEILVIPALYAARAENSSPFRLIYS